MNQIIAAPRWRHFFPKAVEMTATVPSYTTTLDSEGNPVSNIHYGRTYTSNGSSDIQLELPMHADGTENILVSVNGVPLVNTQVVIGMNGVYPIVDYNRYTYDPVHNVLHFQTIAFGSVVSNPPSAGSTVTVDISNPTTESNGFSPIVMPREILIQGANPIDPTLIQVEDAGVKQFQGGYNCTLMIYYRPMHGVARVAANQQSFEYRPDQAYSGSDSFAYRMVNAMGQESAPACIRIKVGT